MLVAPEDLRDTIEVFLERLWATVREGGPIREHLMTIDPDELGRLATEAGFTEVGFNL